MTPQERFAQFVDKDGPAHPTLGACYLWTGCTDKDEYGRFNDGIDPSAPAFRVAYEWEHGPIPKGFEPDHLCKIKLCVRTSHLEIVSAGINNSRAHRKVTDEQVATIKDLLGQGWSQKRIANLVGVGQTTVYMIKHDRYLYAK